MIKVYVYLVRTLTFIYHLSQLQQRNGAVYNTMHIYRYEEPKG